MIKFLKTLWDLRPRSYIKALEKAEKEVTDEIKILLNKYYPTLTYEIGPRCWFYACPACNDYSIFPMDTVEDAALSSTNNNIDLKCLTCDAKIPLTVKDFNHYMELNRKKCEIHDAYVTQAWRFLSSELDIIVGRLKV